MSMIAILRLAALLHLAASTAEATELFGHALPLCGSKAADLAVIFVVAFVIIELGELGRPLRAWLLRIIHARRARAEATKSSGKSKPVMPSEIAGRTPPAAPKAKARATTPHSRPAAKP
jgi:hypothetical protein